MSQVKALLDLLSIEHPIIQAPMAGVSTPELAAAVSNAGGWVRWDWARAGSIRRGRRFAPRES